MVHLGGLPGYPVTVTEPSCVLAFTTCAEPGAWGTRTDLLPSCELAITW
jgi:hypothetical protein